MQRVTLTLDDDLMAELDRLIARRGYQNRSEAIRDLARAGLKQSAVAAGEVDHCVAALVYVYDHSARELSRRLTETYHAHHDLSVATLHVHLDHESCLEVTVLKGSPGEVQHCADHVIAERSVRHGELVLIPVETAVEAHSHGHGPHRHEHLHVRHRKG
ncbi:MAG TPA: nickel-responsive transcriptional regulator NikR [Bauldia sp.]|nr:nickel-responsive transcriptional regulator NikR [Bauldia sp.]